MKKQILSTSAIALGVAMAAPASAQEWDMDWGGYTNVHVGLLDASGSGTTGLDFDGVDVFTDGEFHFRPSITLDNGLTFGYHIEFEAMNGAGGADGIDESYMTIEGDALGLIKIGSENSAGYALMGSVFTPVASTLYLNSPWARALIPATGSGGYRQAAISSLTEVGGNNDVQRISYFTPSFNGLTLGVSYAASSATNAGNNFGGVNRNGAAIYDIFDLGASYAQSFGGVDVGLAARWGTGDSNAVGVSDPTTWAIGGTVGVAGFEVGATYAENDNGVGTGAGDQEGWSFGATYDLAGPWKAGFNTYQGEVNNGPASPSSDYEAYQLAATRTLGAGVTWEVAYTYQKTNNGAVPGNPEIEGNLLSTAVNLSF